MRPRRVRCRALDHRVPNENRLTDSEIFAADFRLRVEGDADCDVCTSGRHWITDRAGRRTPPERVNGPGVAHARRMRQRRIGNQRSCHRSVAVT